jgi:quercetin dioxygenase-like cupin family protein
MISPKGEPKSKLFGLTLEMERRMRSCELIMIEPTAPNPKPKGITSAEVTRLAPLAQYQEGAIVSRELIKKPTGTVSIFAFDTGQGLSEHTAPFDALVQVLEGAVEIRIAGKPHLLEAGDVILMPAGQPHALQALQRFKMVLTMIRS